jgi:hypothetical protein
MLLRIISNIRTLRWDNAILELIVVAVGLLMAFQIDRWWESRDELDRERQYISRLVTDIEKDIDELNDAIDLAQLRLSFAGTLMDVAENPDLALPRPVEFLISVNQAAFTHTPALTSNTFEELRSTGNLGLLRDSNLKDSLFDYYRFDNDERQYQALQLMQEFRHFELAAGILTNRQLRRMHDEWFIVSAAELAAVKDDPVDESQVLQAANRLQEDSEFVAWLPIAYEMQRELIGSNQERLDRANELLGILQNLQSGA